jgi:hypothetical protein
MSCRPDKAGLVWFFRAAGKALPGYVRPQALIAIPERSSLHGFIQPHAHGTSLAETYFSPVASEFIMPCFLGRR